MLSGNWQAVKRILAVRLDNVGDVVMLGPALRTLRQHLPTASITLLASPAGTQVGPLLPWIDEIISLSATWQDASAKMTFDPAREQELVQKLKAANFDAAVIFTSFSQSPYPPAYAAYLAGIPIRLGQSKEFGGSILTQWVKPLADSVHQVDRNLHLLEAAGFEISNRKLELHLSAETEQAAAQILTQAGIEPTRPYIVLAPGASCAARRYDPLRFAQVVQLLTAETGWPVAVVGSQREAALLQTVLEAAASPQIYSLVGQTSVATLAAVIKQASLVLANNSGPLHLADAFERPIVVLYSGTELEEQWRPRTAPARLLRRPTFCSPCYAFNCPYHLECLDIPPHEVVAEALKLMSISTSRC